MRWHKKRPAGREWQAFGGILCRYTGVIAYNELSPSIRWVPHPDIRYPSTGIHTIWIVKLPFSTYRPRLISHNTSVTACIALYRGLETKL